MPDETNNPTPGAAPTPPPTPAPETPEDGLRDSGSKLPDQDSPKDKPADSKDLLNNKPVKKDAEETPTKDESKKEKASDDAPITDWSKVTIEFPDGVEIDQPTLDSFGKTAVELGLTEKQAKALVQYQIDANAAFRENLIDVGIKELRKDWGAKAGDNQKAVMTLIANIDKEMGGTAFSKALNACGATCFPAVCKGLLLLANAMSEDSMGRGGGFGASSKPESILDGLEAEWKRARGEK